MSSYTHDVKKYGLNDISNYSQQNTMSTSIYSSNPRFFKVNPTQFEVLFPFVDIFDKSMSAFMAFEKTYVVVEFGTFVKFILDNIREGTIRRKNTTEKFVLTTDFNVTTKQSSLTDEKEDKLFDGIMYAYEDIYTDSKIVNELLDAVRDEINRIDIELGRTPSSDEVNEMMSPRIKKYLLRINTTNNKALSELWQAFLINIAILNVKSMVICGEYNKNNLSKSNKPVVPLRFIPKLGSELSVLSKKESLTLTEVQNRMIVNDFKNEYNGEILISSLKKSEETDFLDYNLDGEPIDIFKLAESFGYSYDRYFEASQVITDSASGSVTALNDCEEYLDSFSDYIEVLGDLYSNIKYYNSGSKTVILDFDLM